MLKSKHLNKQYLYGAAIVLLLALVCCKLPSQDGATAYQPVQTAFKASNDTGARNIPVVYRHESGGQSHFSVNNKVNLHWLFKKLPPVTRGYRFMSPFVSMLHPAPIAHYVAAARPQYYIFLFRYALF